jgi:hypothetical protein
MILYTSIYPLKNKVREDEILFCLRQNIANPYITKVIVFLEGSISHLIQNPKIVYINVQSRPTFGSFFEQFDDDEVNILANSDIWFDKSLRYLKRLKLLPNDFICLTRLESNGDLFRSDKGDTQDAWVIMGKPRVKQNIDFFLGTPGCDNKIAYIMHINGYRVLNPSKCINAHHVHWSEVRTYSYSDRIMSPYYITKPIGFFQFQISRILLWYLRKIGVTKIID